MTRRGTPLRAGLWIWLTPALLMACLSPRPSLTTPGERDGGADGGLGVIDSGPGAVDVGTDKPDTKVNGAGGAGGVGGVGGVGEVDAGGCVAGAHVCGGQCVSNGDVAHCAQSCSPCAVPTGGAATCDGVICGGTCPSGTKICGADCVPQAMSCGGDCPGGSHDCGGTCQPNTGVSTCGSSCTPCTAPAHGTATCDGAQCGFTCATGYHACGAQCLSNADVASCGASCTACAALTGGTATCDGTSCGGTCPSGTKLCLGGCIPTAQSCMGSCPAGTHNCNGLCQSNTSANSCGSSSCTPCSTPANGVATCDGTQCAFSCSVGYHLCGSACVANSGVANCGTASCAACLPPANGSAICDGLQCGFQCTTGFHACSGSCAGNGSVQSCGTSCTACPVPANGIATCNGTSCGITCNVTFHNCGGLCVSNSSVASCGSSCVACAVPTNGTATCDGTSCGVNIPNFNLTLSTTGIAGATGTLSTSPAGTSCGTGCTGYVPGTSVKITPAAASGSLFGAWEGDCTGQGATCTLTMSSNHAAVAHFRPNKNIMFVSDDKILPSTIGPTLAPADALCAASAQKAFLGGTNWKAWMSTSSATTNINAATHVGASTTGWIRVDGKPMATSMANLLAGKIYYPPRVSALGSEALTPATGTDTDGSAVQDGTCADWTATTGSFVVGVPSSTTKGWTNQTLFLVTDPCGTVMMPVYCFENDSGMAAVSAPVAPSGARHAFLSTTLWMPGGGVGAADAVCQGDATAAGLAGPANYRALLTTTVAATDSTRINLTGQPWYRLDGAQLVAVASDLADSGALKQLTSLNVTSAGIYQTELFVWTGSGVSPSSTAMAMNCTNWTSNSSGLTSFFGGANTSFIYWWNDGSFQPCSNSAPLYCFER